MAKEAVWLLAMVLSTWAIVLVALCNALITILGRNMLFQGVSGALSIMKTVGMVLFLVRRVFGIMKQRAHHHQRLGCDF